MDVMDKMDSVDPPPGPPIENLPLMRHLCSLRSHAVFWIVRSLRWLLLSLKRAVLQSDCTGFGTKEETGAVPEAIK
jgi:hypothetical protein